MSRIVRLAVLVTALASLFAVLSSSAGAVTWHNTGDTAFTANGGGGTLTSTAVTLGWPGSDLIGTAPATFVGHTLSISGTLQFTGATLSSQPAGVHCGFTLTGTTQPVVGVTSGNVDMTCGVYLASSKVCHIEGLVPGHYVNPSGATAGRLIVTTSTTLTVTNGAVGTCPLGNGDKPHLTPLVFTVVDSTQPLGPVITRTA